MTAPGKLIKDTGSRTKNKAQETHKIRQEVIQQDSAVRQTGLGPKCRAWKPGMSSKAQLYSWKSTGKQIQKQLLGRNLILEVKHRRYRAKEHTTTREYTTKNKYTRDNEG